MSTAVSVRRSVRWEVPVAVLLAVIAVVVVGAEPRVIPALYVAAVAPALCRIDVIERRLPNLLVLPGYFVAVVALVAQWVWSGEAPLVALVSGAGYFAFLLVLAIVGGMGMGDVKLAGVLGLAAGLAGPIASVLSPLAAFVLGGVAAILALRSGPGASIPFGPFMLAGFWIALVLGA